MRKTDNTTGEIFDNIYRYNKWPFGSGNGSVWIFNYHFTYFINKFLSDHQDIKRIIDIGCGDWQIAKHFALREKDYVGCDVSNYVLERTKRKYSAKNIRFQLLNAVYDKLPDGDMVIIKDVLQHLSNNDVSKILSKLGKYKYAIVQNDIQKDMKINIDIENGEHRELDIRKPPFNKSSFKLIKYYTESLYLPLNFVRKIRRFPSVYKGVFLRTLHF